MNLIDNDPIRRANAYAAKVVLLPYAVIGVLVAVLPDGLADPLCRAIDFCRLSPDERPYPALASSSVRLQIIAMWAGLPFIVWSLGHRWRLSPHVMEVSASKRFAILAGGIAMALLIGWLVAFIWTRQAGLSNGTGVSRGGLFGLALHSELAFCVVASVLFCSMAMYFSGVYRLIMTIYHSIGKRHG